MFTRNLCLVTLASFAIAASTSAHAASCSTIANNEISNCGFESLGPISSSQYASGTSIPGWTSGGNLDFTGVTSISGTGNANDPAFAPRSGSYVAFLGAEPNLGAGTLSQTFADTAGQTETLNFYLNSEIYSTARNSFSYSIDGVTCPTCSFTNIAELGTYLDYTQTFIGTGSDILTFNFTNDDSYFALDDISVTQPSAVVGPTPEPSSLILLGSGVLGLAGAARRRFLKS